MIWIDDVEFFQTLSFDFESKTFDDDYFQFSGIGKWAIDDSQPSDDDGVAAHSPQNLLPGENSVMSLEVTVPPGGAKLLFDYAVGLGTFSFYRNGSLLLRVNAPGGGVKTFSSELDPGKNTFDWRFDAPAIANLPLSMVWIDNINVIDKYT